MFVPRSKHPIQRALIEPLEPRRFLAASPLPDLTLGVVSSVTGNFIGGDPGNIIVRVGNDGSELAIGTVSLKVYVSPDTSVDDVTFVTAIQQTIKLPGASSTQINIPFIFPGVQINGGHLIATVAPAAQVIDSDPTNDAAVASSPVSVTPPNADLAVQNVAMVAVSPSGIVAGQKATAVATIKNLGNVAISGPVLLNLVVADDILGNGSISLLSAPLARNINLSPNSSIAFAIKFTVPDVDFSGEKILSANVDSSAATLEANLANNTAAAAQPILISAAQVTLANQIISTPPPNVVSGSVGQAIVRLTNDGNILFHGNLPLALYTSTDTILDSADERLLVTNKTASIPVGKFQDIPITFNYPTDLPDNNYHLLTQTNSTMTTLKGATSGPIPIPATDISSTAAVVNISLPFVTLTPVFGTLPGTAFTAGQTLTLPLNLLNTGNVSATGQYSIQLFASPSSDSNDPAAIALTPPITRHLVQKSNTTTTQNFRVKLPTALIPGITYSFVARLTAASIPRITNSVPSAVSPQTFILTG